MSSESYLTMIFPLLYYAPFLPRSSYLPCLPEGEGAAPLEPALPPLHPLRPRGRHWRGGRGGGGGEFLKGRKFNIALPCLTLSYLTVALELTANS